MAQSTKKRTKKQAETTAKKTGSKPKAAIDAALDRNGDLWAMAWELESQLEAKLLDDAIQNAKLALQELEEETRKVPFERRSGLRLREKALKTESAFNRLRALRRGDLLPERHPDE